MEYKVIQGLAKVSSDKSIFRQWHQKFLSAISQVREEFRDMMEELVKHIDLGKSTDKATELLEGTCGSECVEMSKEIYKNLINKAEGEAKAITTIAEANSSAVRAVAAAMNEQGGMNAANLKVAELYIAALANLAKTNNTLIVPSNVADVATMVGTAMNTLSTIKPGATRQSA